MANNGPGRRNNPNPQRPKNMMATITRLLSYLMKRPVMLISALLMVVLSSLCSVAATYMMRPIINNLTDAVAEGVTVLPNLLTSVLQLFLVYLVAAACSYGQANLMAQLAQKSCNTLRKELFDHMQTLPLRFFDQHTHGELMSRFTNDADNVQMALEQSIVQMLSAG
ncbi:MAG: ABC transporter ATP-binding protein, partial [Clostridiales bacterium]|nr:ABC transporter ATP-binding protein [Clostridiales bacterium]